jgi:dCTP diphosphatase
MGNGDLSIIRDRMREFSMARDWQKFHDPKSLLIALMGEVGEVAELLQWLPAETASRLVAEEPLHSRLGEELADVLIYLVRLADVAGIDLPTAALEKLAAAEGRFPVTEVRGTAPDRAANSN